VLFVIGMYMLTSGYVLVGPGQWEATGTVGATAMWQALSLVNGQMSSRDSSPPTTAGSSRPGRLPRYLGVDVR
jgi:hypothetical protein